VKLGEIIFTAYPFVLLGAVIVANGIINRPRAAERKVDKPCCIFCGATSCVIDRVCSSCTLD
jgi:hypothetical protein